MRQKQTLWSFLPSSSLQQSLWMCTRCSLWILQIALSVQIETKSLFLTKFDWSSQTSVSSFTKQGQEFALSAGVSEACETQAPHSQWMWPPIATSHCSEGLSQYRCSVQKALAVLFSSKFTTFGNTNPLAVVEEWKPRKGRWHRMRPCGHFGDACGHEGQDADTMSSVNRDTFGSMGMDRWNMEAASPQQPPFSPCGRRLQKLHLNQPSKTVNHPKLLFFCWWNGNSVSKTFLCKDGWRLRSYA